jgi:hypothetical protein
MTDGRWGLQKKFDGRSVKNMSRAFCAHGLLGLLHALPSGQRTVLQPMVQVLHNFPSLQLTG